ncbi:hypothetical protein EV715DRAFT_291200 [Schizophyllum commune]
MTSLTMSTEAHAEGSEHVASPIAHPVFDLPELLDAIVRAGDSTPRDLRRICLVSRAWKDAAEPVLWENLASLRPLLDLLPDDAIPTTGYFRPTAAVEQYIDADGFMSFRMRELQPDDWTNFKRIAKLVRSPEEQFRILRCPPGKFLLPGLQKVELSGRGVPIEPAFLRLFLSPTITDVRQDRLCRSLSSCVQAISSLPNLARYRLETSGDTEDGQGFYVPFVAAMENCNKLEHICLEIGAEIDIPDLPVLATCPALQELHIFLFSADEIGGGNTIIPCRGFASLKVLIYLWRSYWQPTVHDLHVLLDAVQQHVLLGAVQQHANPATLTKFTVSNLLYSHEPIPLQMRTLLPLHMRTLLPLSEYRNLILLNVVLTLLNVVCSSSIVLAEAEWGEIARWWPALELLRLQAYSAASLPIPRAAARVSVISTSPSTPLRSPTWPAWTPDYAASTRMEMIVHPVMAPIGDAEAVAQYLAKIFPALQAVVIRQPSTAGSPREALWREVGSLLVQRHGRQGARDGEQ